MKPFYSFIRRPQEIFRTKKVNELLGDKPLASKMFRCDKCGQLSADSVYCKDADGFLCDLCYENFKGWVASGFTPWEFYIHG